MRAEFIVGIGEDYIKAAPYIKDDLTELYLRADIKVEIQILPGSRVIGLAKLGKLDALEARFKNREAFTQYIAVDVPIYTELQLHAYGRKDRKFNIQTLDDLNQFSIAASRGSASVHQLKQDFEHIEFVTDEDLALRIINDQRVDLVILNNFNFENYKKMGKAGNLEIKSELIYSFWTYHHIHKSHQDKINLLEKIIEEMKNEGKFVLR